MSAWRLRDYQQEASDSILEAFKEHKSTLLQCFTAGGKTVLFADVIKRMGCRAIVLAHTGELVYQNADTIRAYTGLDVQVEIANHSVSTGLLTAPDVVVGTWQTQVSGSDTKRMERFKPEDFGLLVIDEAHRSVAASYQRIVRYFQRNPELKLLGVTATPKRSDKEALGQVFESDASEVWHRLHNQGGEVEHFDIHYGVEHGWLVEITQQFVNVSGLDFSHLKTVKGDFDQKELSKLMEEQPVIMGVCQPTLEILHGLPPKTLSSVPVDEWGQYLRSLGKAPRRAIMFTSSVHQAELICNILNGALSNLAQWVCGKTPNDKRRWIIEGFKRGDVPVLCNVSVLVEGFNDPCVEVLLVCKPTKSLSTYEQLVGRGLRPLPGVVDGPETAEARQQAIRQSEKPFVRIIDFVGNCGRHKLVSCIDVLGGKISDKSRQQVIEQAQLEGKPIRVSRELTKAEIEEEKRIKAETERKRLEQAEKYKNFVGKSHFTFQNVDPFDALHISRSTPWSRNHFKAPSEGMARFLQKRGINVEAQRITFTDAGKLIGKIKKMEDDMPATQNQQRVLMKRGIPVNGMTKKDATKRIDQLAKEEGWK